MFYTPDISKILITIVGTAVLIAGGGSIGAIMLFDLIWVQQGESASKAWKVIGLAYLAFCTVLIPLWLLGAYLSGELR